MVCACCGKPKKTLEPRKSKVIAGVSLILCDFCRTNKHEPRHIIVLAAHADSIDAVSKYIRDCQYCGPEILGRELTD